MTSIVLTAAQIAQVLAENNGGSGGGGGSGSGSGGSGDGGGGSGGGGSGSGSGSSGSVEVPFGGTTARTVINIDSGTAVLTFVTPAGPTQLHGAANISISEYAGFPPSPMRAVLSESPNASDGPYGWVSEGNSNTLTMDIGGNPNGMGTAELKGLTRYYVTLTRAAGGTVQAYIAKPGYL